MRLARSPDTRFCPILFRFTGLVVEGKDFRADLTAEGRVLAELRPGGCGLRVPVVHRLAARAGNVAAAFALLRGCLESSLGAVAAEARDVGEFVRLARERFAVDRTRNALWLDALALITPTRSAIVPRSGPDRVFRLRVLRRAGRTAADRAAAVDTWIALDRRSVSRPSVAGAVDRRRSSQS